MLDLSARAFDDRTRQGEPVRQSYLDLETARPDFLPEQLVIAQAGSDPVGYALLVNTNHEPGGSYEIAELGVIPALRGRGIGAALISHCLNWVKSHGASVALVAAFSSNRVSTVYWRMGFRPDQTRTFRFFTRPIPIEEPAEAEVKVKANPPDSGSPPVSTSTFALAFPSRSLA
jgi:GNAT superfamily N-acetyltransferase